MFSNSYSNFWLILAIFERPLLSVFSGNDFPRVMSSKKEKRKTELEKVRKIRSRVTSVLTLSKKTRSLFQLRLGDRRLRGLHGCRLGGRRHSDQRTEMQARLEPPGRS
jgi:hypothetical protein